MSRRKQFKPLHILDENSPRNHKGESMQKDDGSSKMAATDPGGIAQSPEKNKVDEDQKEYNEREGRNESPDMPLSSQKLPPTTASTSLASPSPEGTTGTPHNSQIARSTPTSSEKCPDDVDPETEQNNQEQQKENIAKESIASDVVRKQTNFDHKHERGSPYRSETNSLHSNISNVPQVYSGLTHNYSALPQYDDNFSQGHGNSDGQGRSSDYSQARSHDLSTKGQGHERPFQVQGHSPLSSPVPTTNGNNGFRDDPSPSPSLSHPSTSSADGYNMFYAQQMQLEAMQSAFTYSLMGSQGSLARNVCPWCGVTKAGPAALRRHLLKHTGERPFTCQLCNKSFKAKRNLQYHQYMHHGVESKDSNISERFCEARKRKLELETAKVGMESQMKHYYQLNGQVDDDHKLDGHSSDPYLMYSALHGPQKLSSMAHQWETHLNFYNNLKQLDAQDENGNRKSLASLNVDNDFINYDHQSFTTTTDAHKHPIHSLKSFDRLSGSPHRSTDVRNGRDVSDPSSSQVRDHEDRVKENCDISSDVFRNGSDKETAGHQPFTCELCGTMFNGEQSQQEHLKTVHNVDIDLSKVLDGRFLRARQQAQLDEDVCASTHDRTVEAERLDMVHRPWRTVRDEMTEGEGGENTKGTETTPPDKLKQSKASHSSRIHGSYGSDIDDQSENIELEYPSSFPGLKHQISIKNETVLVTRLDGVNKATRKKVSLYKCHICSQMFNSLSRMQCHLSIHYDRHLNVYQCSLCGANFKFRIQLHRHMKRHKRREYRVQNDEVDNSLPSQDDHDGPEGPGGRAQQGEASGEGHDGTRNPGHLGANDDCNTTQPHHKHIPSHFPGYSRYIRWHNHRYSHYTNRHYICSYCNKTFYRLFSLQRHERVHTGYKPCHCEDCGKGFNEPRNLHLHRMRYHGNQDQDADQNDEALNSPQSLSPKPHAPQSDLGDSIDSVDVSQDNTDSNNPHLNIPDKSPDPILMIKDDVERPHSRETPHSVAESSSREPLHLASQIRQKEQLGEDVTVVIPTGANDSNTEAPRSNISDNTSWGEVASDSDSSQSNEIVSAPWKSIMAHKQALKSKRKGLPHRIPSPASPEALNVRLPSPDIAIKQESSSPSLVDMNKMCTEASVLSQGQLATMVLSPMVLSGVSREGGLSALAANPLYLHSPIMSGLASSPLSLLQSNHNLLSPMSANMDMMRSSLGLPLSHPVSWSDSVSHSPSAPVSSSPTPSSSIDANSSASLLYSRSDRSSSLSRTHSRLNVVRRDPLRREEACKPTLLPDGRTVYRCSYCNKDFGSFSDINRHMDFHEDIRPYKCKFCDYYARTNSQLKVHMMRHQGIREFHCKLCNYKGVTQSDLNRHMKSQIHIMKAQNECRICGEGFVSPKNLEKHIGICSGHRSNNSSPSSSGHSRLESPSTSRLEQSYYIKTEHT